MILEPPTHHRCTPPRHRPKSEWRSMPVPAGLVKPADRGSKVTMPTPYSSDTVWVCTCGISWIRRPGLHYGRNPNLGHTEGYWSPLPWYAFRIRRRIREYELRATYERDKAVVESYVLPGEGNS